MVSPLLPLSAGIGALLIRSCLMALACGSFAVSKPAIAATYVVTSTADYMPFDPPIPGTLRNAINSANTNANRDTITFAPALIGAFGATRISLVAPLPSLVHPVVMDGAPDDPLGRGVPPIEITPVNAPILEDGLRLANNSVLRGVALFGFGRQVMLVGQSNLVESCHLGCSSYGETVLSLIESEGVHVSHSFNRIIHNVVSGNKGPGIVLETAIHCEVLDNFVGLLPGGEVLGNGGAGITLDNARTNVIGRAPFRGNIIAGNFKGGILLGSRFPDFSTRGTVIEGNVIGLSLYPEADFVDGPPGNGSHGIALYQQRQLTIRNNEIYASHGHGIYLNGSSAITNVIDGNYIGSTRPGWGNAGSGISVFLSGQNVVTNNEIAGNAGNGIQVDSSSANQITGNLLQQNRHAGVHLNGPDNAFAQAAANRLEENSILYNGGPGVVQLGNARQNLFYANDFLGNGGLGIDLGGTNEAQAVYSPNYDIAFNNGVSRGDGPGYAPTDINVYPYQLGIVLKNAALSNSVAQVGGYFLTTPQNLLVSGGLYYLQFYSSTAGDPSGYGEGASRIGGFVVGPIPSFNAPTNFLATFTNSNLDPTALITATVTRTNSSSSTANQTSEFSNFLPFRSRAPVAVGDMVVTLEDQAVEFAVKSNDFDPDGDAITVESVSIDAPGLGFGPPVGIAVLLPNQRVRFTPAANLNRLTVPGPVNIRYVINDGHGLKAVGIAAVSITPVNDAPQALPDLATMGMNNTVIIPVLANDKDIDGDPLTILSTTPAAHGTVTINGGKNLSYTPTTGYAGVDTFNYTISDGAGGQASSTVTVLIRDTATRTDLAVRQSVEPAVAATNVPVTFHLAVTNAGPLPASRVVLLVNVSGDATTPLLSSSQGSFTNLSGHVRFDLGLLPTGIVATANVTVRGNSAGPLVSSASVVSLVPDAFPQNDVTTSVTINGGTEPALSIADLGDRVRLSWGAEASGFRVAYSLGLENSSSWRPFTGPVQTQGSSAYFDVFENAFPAEPFIAFRLIRR